MSDRPLEHLRRLHHAHVIAVKEAAVYEDRALELTHMHGTEEHEQLIRRRRKAHTDFYAAVDELERNHDEHE